MGNMMKAVIVAAPGKVEIREDIPIPGIGDYECLVKTHACGLCNGTDLQVIGGTIEKKAGFLGFPTVLGHEGAAEVIKVGPKVRHIQIGDRFIHNNLRSDVGNGYTKTYGSMAEYGLVCDHEAMAEDGFLPSQMPFYKKQKQFPKEIDYIDAAMILSLAESHSAAVNFGTKQGDNVLIYGSGPMGTALAMFMKLRGAEKVTIIDCIPERLANAKRVAKADRLINFAETPVKEAIGAEEFDLVVDAVGKSTILTEGSQFLKPFGKMCSLGVLRKDDMMINVGQLKWNTSLHMLNWPNGEYDIMPETIRYILDGAVNPKDFYSHVMPFTEVNQAVELVRSRKALKVILNFDI
ncbi:MAG: zinc-binding dehydrogenase [Lachnospiraceae bacterium]|nr:zinc-binding dehydrogenase [Lachnospiraceae bacterium]